MVRIFGARNVWRTFDVIDITESSNVKIVKNWTKVMAPIRQEFQGATNSMVTLRADGHHHGYSGRTAAHKSHMMKTKKAQRINWCSGYRKWTLEQ